MPEAKPTSKTGFPQAVYAYEVPVSFPADGNETDTTYDLPADGVVLDCYLIVDTAEVTGTTKLLDVGLLSSESGGDADGFLDGVSCAATGIVYPTLASAGQTRGALIRDDEDGAGALVPGGHNIAGTTAKSVSITASAADWAEFAGRIVFLIARDPGKTY